MKKIIYTIMAAAVTMLAISATAQTISTYAGNAAIGSTFSGDGGAATAAGMRLPAGCITDAAGNFYVADRDNHVIRKVSASGIISTFAGNNISGDLGEGGAATAARLSQPIGLNIDAAGNIYITDYGNNKVKMVNTTGIITTIAGTGTSGHTGDGGAATAAKLNHPTDVVLDATGNIYINDYGSGYVRKVDGTGIITNFAGGGSSYTDGIPATDADLYGNNGIRIDAGGNVIIADMNNNRLVKVTPAGLAYTIAGDGTAGYTGDGGAATAAKLYHPTFLETDKAGNIFFSDGDNEVVRKIDASGVITTVAGNNVYGYTGDGGPATAASIGGPTGLAFNASGDMFVVSQAYSIVRKVTATPITVTGTATICKTKTTTLSNSTGGGVWSSSNTAVATVNAAGVVTGTGAGTATIAYGMGLGYGAIAVTINDCALSAIDIDNNTEPKVYPNPSNGSFIIELSGTTEPTTVTITNIMGQVIAGKTLQAQHTISFNDIPAGNYVVKVASGDKIYRTKIAVTK